MIDKPTGAYRVVKAEKESDILKLPDTPLTPVKRAITIHERVLAHIRKHTKKDKNAEFTSSTVAADLGLKSVRQALSHLDRLENEGELTSVIDNVICGRLAQNQVARVFKLNVGKTKRRSKNK